MALDIQEFKDAGFNEGQAKLLAHKLPREREDDVITKKDLIISEQTLRAGLHADKYEIKTDIAVIKQTMATKTDIAELKEDIQELRSKLKVEIFVVKSELREEISNLRTELKGDISNSKVDILKWMFSLFITTIISIGAMVSPLWLNKDVKEVSQIIDNIKK